MIIDDQYKNEIDIFHNIATQLTKQTEAEVSDMPIVL